MEDFENWIPSVKAEYEQLVTTKEADSADRQRWSTPGRLAQVPEEQEQSVAATTVSRASMQTAMQVEQMAARFVLWSVLRHSAVGLWRPQTFASLFSTLLVEKMESWWQWRFDASVYKRLGLAKDR